MTSAMPNWPPPAISRFCAALPIRRTWWREAIGLGHAGIGIADRNSVAGVVRAHSAVETARSAWQKEHGDTAQLPFKLMVGARLVFSDGTPDILAYPEDRDGWGHLCRLLSLGNAAREKGDCLLRLDDLLATAGESAADRHACPERSRSCPLSGPAGPGRARRRLACRRHALPRRRPAAAERAQGTGTRRPACPCVAVNDVLYHAAAQRPLQDVVTCIREG